jgi:hypothetical protein
MLIDVLNYGGQNTIVLQVSFRLNHKINRRWTSNFSGHLPLCYARNCTVSKRVEPRLLSAKFAKPRATAHDRRNSCMKIGGVFERCTV